MLRRLIAGIGNSKANKSYLNTLNESVIRRLFYAVFDKLPSHPTDEHLVLKLRAGEFLNSKYYSSDLKEEYHHIVKK